MSPRPSWRIPWRYVVLALGPLLAVAIFSRVDLGEVARSLRRADPWLFAAALVLNGILLQLRGLRWRYLVRAQGIPLAVGDALGVNYAAFAAAFVTPGRVGDLARGLHLVDLGNSYIKSFFAVLYERVMDLAVIVVFGLVGFYVFADLFQSVHALPLVLLVLGAAAGSFLLLRVGALRRAGYAFLRRLLPARAAVGWGDVAEGFRRMTPGRDGVTVLFTLAMWGTYFLQGWVLTQALGIPIAFLHVAALICLAALLMMLPISVAGVGTRDAAFVYAFWKLGLPAEDALAFSLLLLATQIVHAVLGYLLWARRPELIRLRGRRTEAASGERTPT